MPSSRFLPARPCRGVLALITLCGLAACESDRHPPAPAPQGTAGPAGEAATPEMEARGTFFTGQVEVETLLNRGGFAGRGGGDSGSAEGSGRRDGGGGRGVGRGRGAGGSAYSTDAAKSPGSETAPRIYASNLPAVRLHLRLTNHGTEPIEVEVTDFDSDLGNFVVQPAKIMLPPNESVEADPMTSRLGVTSDEIPLTVTLRAGDQTEKQVLSLHLIKSAAVPAQSSAPSGPVP